MDKQQELDDFPKRVFRAPAEDDSRMLRILDSESYEIGVVRNDDSLLGGGLLKVLCVLSRSEPLIDSRRDIDTIGPKCGGYIGVHVFIEMEPDFFSHGLEPAVLQPAVRGSAF